MKKKLFDIVVSLSEGDDDMVTTNVSFVKEENGERKTMPIFPSEDGQIRLAYMGMTYALSFIGNMYLDQLRQDGPLRRSSTRRRRPEGKSKYSLGMPYPTLFS